MLSPLLIFECWKRRQFNDLFYFLRKNQPIAIGIIPNARKDKDARADLRFFRSSFRSVVGLSIWITAC